MTPDILHRALKAGVRDVLAAPFDRDQLLAAVNRAGDALTNYQAALESPAIPGPTPAAPHKARNGKVVTVFSTKGGAGKSVLAVNNRRLARQEGRPGESCSSTPTSSSATSPSC